MASRRLGAPALARLRQLILGGNEMGKERRLAMALPTARAWRPRHVNATRARLAPAGACRRRRRRSTCRSVAESVVVMPANTHNVTCLNSGQGALVRLMIGKGRAASR